MREAVTLAGFLDDPLWRTATVRVSLDDRTSSESGELLWSKPVESVVLAVGPEGGWSDAERARIEEAGAHTLRLGVRVLRAETAVFVGLTVLQHRMGDLRP